MVVCSVVIIPVVIIPRRLYATLVLDHLFFRDARGAADQDNLVDVSPLRAAGASGVLASVSASVSVASLSAPVILVILVNLGPMVSMPFSPVSFSMPSSARACANGTAVGRAAIAVRVNGRAVASKNGEAKRFALPGVLSHPAWPAFALQAFGVSPRSVPAFRHCGGRQSVSVIWWCRCPRWWWCFPRRCSSLPFPRRCAAGVISRWWCAL